jgi:hypothetical protein
MASGPLVESHFRCPDNYAKNMQISDLAVFFSIYPYFIVIIELGPPVELIL